MVAADEKDFPVKTTQNVGRLGVFVVRQITRMIGDVNIRYDRIPAPNELLVHFVDVRKRAAAKADDVFVAVMRIGAKKNLHG